MSLFKKLGGIVGDVANIATAPLETAATITRAATKKVSEAVTDVKEGIREAVEDKDDGR